MGTWSDFATWWRKLWRRESPGEYLPVSPESRDEEPAPVSGPERTGRLIHWPVSKRDRQLATLQEGYAEMLGLMRGIREHLEKQQVVQEKMVDVLDRLPGSMEGLKNVGRAAEQQVEVMSLLRQQIEAGASHDRQLVESMNHFNQTLSVMDQTSRTSGRAVEQLIGKAADSEKMLRETMERSERRFMVVTAIFALIAVLAAGTVMALAWGGRLGAGRAGGSPTPTGSTEGLPPGAVPLLTDEGPGTAPVWSNIAPPAITEPVPPPLEPAVEKTGDSKAEKKAKTQPKPKRKGFLRKAPPTESPEVTPS